MALGDWFAVPGCRMPRLGTLQMPADRACTGMWAKLPALPWHLSFLCPHVLRVLLRCQCPSGSALLCLQIPAAGLQRADTEMLSTWLILQW